MYYIKNNDLKNDSRIKLNKNQMMNINNLNVDKKYICNVYFKQYYLIEMIIYIKNHVFKYFTICKNKNDMNDFRNKLEKYR